VREVIRLLRGENTLVVVDPVMADDGKLYSIFSEQFPAEMKKLCADADVIVPNITEAALLTGLPYYDGIMTEDIWTGILEALSALGPKEVVLTGVRPDENSLGAVSYSAKTKSSFYAGHPLIPGMYHGSGDVFSSVLVSAMLCGSSLEQACENAVEFTAGSIQRTFEEQTDRRYGVNFEAGLAQWATRLNQ